MRFHVVSLPHTMTTRDYAWCAYTEKVRKFASMMHDRGHDVFLYAGDKNDARCTEHIPIVHEHEQLAWWPEWDPQKEMWPDGWRVNAPWWEQTNARAIAAIRDRIEDRDFVCIIAGICQKPIADAFPEHPAVEWGIGYKGTFADFRVFESYAWQHHIYGREHKEAGHFWDAVIPNFFDPDDFPPFERADIDPYLFFIGRFIPDKGVQIVKDVVNAIGAKLIIAGQGSRDIWDGVRFVDAGVVRPIIRRELMGNATAVLAPTMYLEPFGGVAVEAQLCGTPAITTDFGAFTETVEPQWRCSTLQDFIDATLLALNVTQTDRFGIANRARRYLMPGVAREYEAYFNRLTLLWGEGWYQRRDQ